MFNFNSHLCNHVNRFKRKNKICNAGYNTVAVMSDGKVQPCFFIRTEIGSIYKDINFYKRLIRCPSDLCVCPFPVYEEYLFKKALYELKVKNAINRKNGKLEKLEQIQDRMLK